MFDHSAGLPLKGLNLEFNDVSFQILGIIPCLYFVANRKTKTKTEMKTKTKTKMKTKMNFRFCFHFVFVVFAF